MIDEQARLLRPKPTMEEAFNRALLSRAVHRSTTQLVELLLARVDVERVLAAAAIQGEQALGKSGEGGADPAQDMDRFMEVYAVLSFALGVLAGESQFAGFQKLLCCCPQSGDTAILTSHVRNQSQRCILIVRAPVRFCRCVPAEQEEKDSNLRMEKFSCDWVSTINHDSHERHARASAARVRYCCLRTLISIMTLIVSLS